MRVKGEGFAPYVGVWLSPTYDLTKRIKATIHHISNTELVAHFGTLAKGEYTLFISACFYPGWGIFNEHFHTQKIVVAQEGECRVYPNPAKDVSYITFSAIPRHCTISIYTLTGQRVWHKVCDATEVKWYLENEAGQNVAPGIYIYIIKNTEGKVVKKGKLCIIR
jgi:hypothetical protein